MSTEADKLPQSPIASDEGSKAESEEKNLKRTRDDDVSEEPPAMKIAIDSNASASAAAATDAVRFFFSLHFLFSSFLLVTENELDGTGCASDKREKRF